MYTEAIEVIRRVLKGRTYELPDEPDDDTKFVIPVSGGADSTAMAILLCTLFPNVNWELIFTDTGAEESALEEGLQRLETYVGRKIRRINAEKNLWELIEGFGFYLPGADSRYCTRELKLKPFKAYLKTLSNTGERFFFVGLRADEPSRVGFDIEGSETVFPFRELGLVREDIFAILSGTIGIPTYYRRRTRSGCTCCPFQRKAELVGLLQEQPAAYAKGMQYEKLSGDDLNRHPEAPSLYEETHIGGNWMHIPLPASEEEPEGKHSKGADLFGRGIFVGVEFFMDGMLSSSEFIWHQRVVCYSPTRAGVKKQLDNRYQHLLGTGEVFQMSPDEVREKARFGIYYVEIDGALFDPDGPKGKSYTWQSGTSMTQMRHIVQWVTRSLNAEALRQDAAMQAKPMTVQEEWKATSQEALSQIREETGNVSLSFWYQPKEKIATVELDPEDEEAAKSIPCPMCTI